MKQKKKIILLLATFVFATTWLYPLHVLARERGQFYVIGTGPAGPHMATLQALDIIKQMDAIIASNGHVKLFTDYIGNKPVLFDPWEMLFTYKGKIFRELNKEERAQFIKKRFQLLNERVEQINALLADGKNVGLLDNGNPCLFAPSHWYVERFDPLDVVIIPGMGSDAAAMAALGKSAIPAHNTRFVLQSTPFYITGPMMENIQMLKDLVKYPTTMILYTALWNPEKLFETLGNVYPPDMPCAVVYWAGYPDREHIVRGTVADMGPKLAKEKEKYMGLLLIGRFLKGNPYEGAMRHHGLKKK